MLASLLSCHAKCGPLVSHGEYANGTYRWTPDHYIMLSTMDAASVITVNLVN